MSFGILAKRVGLFILVVIGWDESGVLQVLLLQHQPAQVHQQARPVLARVQAVVHQRQPAQQQLDKNYGINTF